MRVIAAAVEKIHRAKIIIYNLFEQSRFDGSHRLINMRSYTSATGLQKKNYQKFNSSKSVVKKTVEKKLTV